MFNKFSIGVILAGQLRTMKIYGENRWDRPEIFIVFILPLISPVLQAFLKLHLSGEIVGTIVSAASIFAGLLLNLLVLLYSILSAVPSPDPAKTLGVEDERVKDLIEHLFYNISFSILISTLIVIAALVTLTGLKWPTIFSEMIVYYFGVQLFLLIAQILKRFHKLLEHQISRTRQKKQLAATAIWGK